MELSIVFQSIILITIMIIIGALLSRTFSFNADTRDLFISLIVNVAMPCIILSSIFSVEVDEQMFKMITIVFCISILVNLVGMGLGALLSFVFYKKNSKTREVALLSGLGNTGFIGIPLCATLFGPEGALFAAIFDAGVDFTMWTVGVLLLQKKGGLNLHSLKAMVNIPTAAIIFGLLIAYFQFPVPSILGELTDQFAALAAPLAMFYIGVLVMTLQRSKVKEAGSIVVVPIGVKLLILPIIAAFMIQFIQMDLLIVQVVLIQAMMPTLTLASILFAKYSADEDVGAITTVLSTILALITIPLMIYVMGQFFIY